MTTEPTTRTRYDQLRDRGWELVKTGQLEEARGVFDQAYELARKLDDKTTLDIAYCNRSAVAIRLHETGDLVPRLQEMLLGTVDSRVAMLSAYNLALAYDGRKEFKKVLFYGQIAQKYAVELGERELEASAVNILGNARRSLGDFESAVAAYREALELFGESQDGVRQALVLDNLGYSLLVGGETKEGFRLLIKSLRMLRRAKAPLFETGPRLSLAFAYLQVNRPGPALRHLHRALDVAGESGHEEDLKYGLLLLGEAYKQAEDVGTARECFELLQELYYPTMAQVPEMLLGVDVAKIINIKA